jgi:hypothetical protein
VEYAMIKRGLIMLQKSIAIYVMFLALCALKATAQCPSLDEAKPQVQLDYLRRDRTILHGPCVVRAINNIGFSRYAPGVKTLITFLDFGFPTDPKTGRVMMVNAFPYAAVPALASLGKLAEPDLLEAIADSTTSPVARNNAIGAIFLMYPEDPSGAVRVLVRATKAIETTNWEGSQRLFEAARKAAGTCKVNTVKSCNDALATINDN